MPLGHDQVKQMPDPVAPPDPVQVEYLATVMGPGVSLGPQAMFHGDLDAMLEFVRENVQNGAIVTVASHTY